MADGKINLIFDCDGTLIDSYGAISDRIYRQFKKHNIICNPVKIREYCLRTNANDCILFLSERCGLDGQEMIKEVHSLAENHDLITLYPNVVSVLENNAFNCFVYTHRGTSCVEIFEKLRIKDYFTEIVDRTYGFERKPASEGVDYLVKKYDMDKDNTYYVGDRTIDIECGINAGIKTIFFNSCGLDLDCSKADYVVQDLSEINTLF